MEHTVAPADAGSVANRILDQPPSTKCSGFGMR